jgi:two-component system chemotaxis sensor kinase CheA
MDARNQDFLNRLLLTFEVEAREHIRVISSGLITLENASAMSQPAEVVETILREAHSLKGAARAVNLTDVEAVCQALESIFTALKRRELTVSTELYDMLHQVLDGLGARLVAAAAGPNTSQTPIWPLLQRLEDLPKAGAAGGTQEAGVREHASHFDPTPPLSTPSRPSPALAETVRISTAKLDALLLRAEELLSAKLMASQRAAELSELAATLTAWCRERVKIDSMVHARRDAWEEGEARHDRARSPERREQSSAPLRRLIGPPTRRDDQIAALDSQLATLAKALEQDQRGLARMVDDLLDEMKKVAMLPCASLLEIVPKLVRDLARDSRKEVKVVIRGSDIEIDRRILEELKAPLIQIVRNSIDHGIEVPQERERKRKPRQGTMTVTVTQQHGRQVELVIADDGVGIDLARVKSAAHRLGLIRPEDADTLDSSAALALAFHSGVSTSPMITDISGRGLGLAIVREKVEALGGRISLDSAPDVGTTFRLVLPLTIATVRGVLVRVAERFFVLPTTSVERVLRFDPADVRTIENRATLRLGAQTVALVSLAEALELPRYQVRSPASGGQLAVVLAAAELRMAFLVDAVLHEQEVLVKQLGPQLLRIRNVAGATVLGSGQVVPVLNVPDVLKSAILASTAAAKSTRMPTLPEVAPQKSVLVVEDSITSRILLKNLLEAAGYRVRTAVDGLDGLTQLRAGAVDIVVSDVDMPRMNGFDLTLNIRADSALAALPVILVTALASPADRERGIEVGANAYLVKSSFDQSNLLEVMQRLV